MAIRGKIKLTGKQRSFRLGSARDRWWKELQNWDGKSVQDWKDAMAALPPSKPTKGKYKDSGEPPSGWLSWFKSEGLATYFEDDSTSDAWSDAELEAAIAVYDDDLGIRMGQSQPQGKG